MQKYNIRLTKTSQAEIKDLKVGETFTVSAVGNPERSLVKKERVETGRGLCFKHKGTVQAQVKTWGNLLIYGMGVQKLANTLGITISEAKELREKYFAAFPKVKALMDSIEAETKRTKMAYSPLDGRIKHLSFMDWDHPKHVGGAINQAKNFPFQGCGASTTKLAMARLRKRIKRENWDARLVNVVHDKQSCCV